MENVHNGNAIIKGQILYLRSRHIAKPVVMMRLCKLFCECSYRKWMLNKKREEK